MGSVTQYRGSKHRATAYRLDDLEGGDKFIHYFVKVSVQPASVSGSPPSQDGLETLSLSMSRTTMIHEPGKEKDRQSVHMRAFSIM